MEDKPSCIYTIEYGDDVSPNSNGSPSDSSDVMTVSSSGAKRYDRVPMSERIDLCSNHSPEISPQNVTSDENSTCKSVSSISPVNSSDLLSSAYGSGCSKTTCSSCSVGCVAAGDGSPVLDSPTEHAEVKKGERSTNDDSTKSGTSLYLSLSSEESPHPPNELSSTKSEVGSDLSPTSSDQDAAEDNSEAEQSEDAMSVHSRSSVQSAETESDEEEGEEGEKSGQGSTFIDNSADISSDSSQSKVEEKEEEEEEEEEEGEEKNGQRSTFINHSAAISSDSSQSEVEEGRDADGEEMDGTVVAKSFTTYRTQVTPLTHLFASSGESDDHSSPGSPDLPSPKLVPSIRDNSSLSNMCDAVTPSSGSCTPPQRSASSNKLVSPDSDPLPPVVYMDSKPKPLPHPKLPSMTDEPIVISPDVHVPPLQQESNKSMNVEASGHSGDSEGCEDGDGEGCATDAQGGGSADKSSDKDGGEVKDVVLVEEKENFKPEPQFKVGYQYRSVVKQLMETQVSLHPVLVTLRKIVEVIFVS